MRKVVCLGLVLAWLFAIMLTVTVETVQAADTTYTVQRGDSLSSIASRYGLTVSTLAQNNGINNVNNIFVGQVLKINSTDSTAAAPATTTGGKAYLVQPGDSLSRIADLNGVSINELAALNGLSLMSYIYAGQTLKLPGSVVTPVTAAPVATVVPVKTIAAAPIAQGGGTTNRVSSDRSGRWIDVNLSQQRLTAYEGNTSVFTSAVSTGTSIHPTVTGTFNIYLKYSAQAMTDGQTYYLPNVPYVMYFYASYSIHGTYWHNNFGHPMSHGCVNMPTPAAKFMYSWASIGTPVVVHY